MAHAISPNRRGNKRGDNVVCRQTVFMHAARDLEREAGRLRQETERVRHNSRATITWLKEAGLIDPKVDPDTGEYLDIVGSQRDIRYNTEGALEDTSESDDTEDLPPEDQPPHSPGPLP